MEKRTWTTKGLVLLVVLVVVECMSYGTGKLLQKKWCMYGEPRTPAGRIVQSYDEYMRRRDPVVGWPFPDQFGSDLFTATGARPSPAFPDATPETSCISLYGDSFTQSPNTDANTWGNVLAELAGCPVANYGQGGYGTDQAFLRYQHNPRDHSSVVILSHLTEDVLRILTRDRDLILYEMWWAYKPRFVLDANGKLELVPMPALSEQDHLRLEGLESPPLHLENENFGPGGPAGATLLRFPFTLSLARNFGDFRMRAKLARQPSYVEFYRRGHPMHGLEILREIGKAFRDEAARRGQVPIVMLLPNRTDVEHFRKANEWYYAPLLEELANAGVDVIEFGTRLAEASAGHDLDEFYDESGHFRQQTDKLLAAFVFAKVRSLAAWETRRASSGK